MSQPTGVWEGSDTICAVTLEPMWFAILCRMLSRCLDLSLYDPSMLSILLHNMLNCHYHWILMISLSFYIDATRECYLHLLTCRVLRKPDVATVGNCR